MKKNDVLEEKASKSNLLNKSILFNFLFTNLILVGLAIGDIFFFVPSKITSGGIFGLALIIFHFFKIKERIASYIGILVFLINIPLLMYSYFYFEISYFKKSFYCTLALPLIEAIFDNFIKIFNYKIIEPNLYFSLIIGTLIQSFFTALIMYQGSSTGGLDILARILNRFFKNLSIGASYTIFSLLIIFFSFFVFDSEKAIASILSILGTGFLIDFFLKNIFKIKDLNYKYRKNI